MADKRIEMLKLLRKARRLDPEAFDTVIEDYGERGEVALESGKKAGRKPHITWDARALLFIAVESETDEEAGPGRSEKQAQNIIAAGEWDVLTRKWGGPGWQSANTVKAQLRVTRHLREEDPEFAVYVDRTRDIIDNGWEPTEDDIAETERLLFGRELGK